MHADAAPPPLLKLDQVRRVFDGGRVAVDQVDLVVPAGDFVSLVGPSGCGKSTLLRLVAGLDRPTAGRIERRADIGTPGFVFQDAALMPWASALDNAALPLRLAGLPRARARDRARQALAAVGLGDAEQALPRELSGGMRMRVSLARALVATPRLWLLDEPFGALDEITRFALNQTLLGLCQPGGPSGAATALFVTHSVYEAVYLSRRVLVLARPGRVLQEIAVDEPYPRPPAWRSSPGFHALCAQVSDALQRACGRAEAP